MTTNNESNNNNDSINNNINIQPDYGFVLAQTQAQAQLQAQARAQVQQLQQHRQRQQGPSIAQTPSQFSHPSSRSSNVPAVPRQSATSTNTNTNTTTTHQTKGPLAGGRQITRNRTSYSCHTCRRRKVKCDKVHPICGNCSRNGTECVYDTTPLTKGSDPRNDQDGATSAAGGGHAIKRRRGSFGALDDDVDGADELQSIYDSPRDQNAGSRAIKARLEKLTSMIEKISNSTSTSTDANTGQSVDKQYIAPLQNSTLGSGSRQGDAGGRLAGEPRTADLNNDEFPIPSGRATDPVDPVGSLNLGHLSLEDGGKSRYVGTTYWAYISHEINELNQLLKDQNRSRNVSPPDEGSIGESMTADQRTPGHSWRIRHGDESTMRDGGSATFQKSVLFPSGDSPCVNEKAVEPDTLRHVPTKRQSHILYKGFMSGVHAVSPVIHPPTILKLYNAFWDWYEYNSYSGESCPDPSFIPLIYAIWYGGSVTISIRTIQAEFNTSSRSALSIIYSEEVTRWLTKISFPRSPSLQGLAAYLLVQTILSKEEEPLTSSLFISLAMRVAQTMGLHRDPAQFGIRPSEAEYRRRLWWHIVHMDGVVAMCSGLPPLVNEENYWDVRETSEIKDTLLGTPEAEQYEQLVASNMRAPDNPDNPTVCGGMSMVNVYYLYARGKYVMASAVRRILRIQLGTKPVTRRDMEELRAVLLDLQLKLRSIIDRIPDGRDLNPISVPSAAFSCRSPVNEVRSSDTELPGEGPTGCLEQYHSPVLVSFHKWARILLSLFIDKAFCVAYQPFLKNAKSRIWPAARQSALRHCHGFMEKFILLVTDPDFQPFQWSWPGNHQPMHATMIMLIDLYERPWSPEAVRSRAYIDKIFSFTGPDGGVVGGEDGITTARPLKDGGREAWDMIRRLRQKSWQKVGLDPHRLWTEQAQIQAGAAPVANDYRDYQDCSNIADSYYYYPLKGNYGVSNNSNNDSAPAASSQLPSRPFSDFSRMFFNMTRNHVNPVPVSPMQPSPLRYAYPLNNPTTSAPATPPLQLSTPQYPLSPATAVNTGSNINNNVNNITPTNNNPLDATLAPTSIISSPEAIAPFNTNTDATNIPLTQQPAALTTASTSAISPYMDTTFSSSMPMSMSMSSPMSPMNNTNNNNSQSIPAICIPDSNSPSIMDPNLTFDWDQWDAVFGQHLPVPDELVEKDPVSGFEYGDYGSVASPVGFVGSSPGAIGGGMSSKPCDWEGFC